MSTKENEPDPIYGTPEWQDKHAKPAPDETDYWLGELQAQRENHKRALEVQKSSYIAIIALIILLILGVIITNAESY